MMSMNRFSKNRRTTLKTFGAVSVAAFAPTLANATDNSTELLPTPIEPINDDKGIDLSVVTEDKGGLSVTFTNHASATAQVKHVYPGIVESKGKTFDINDILVNSPLTIEAGESVTVFMPKIAPVSAERALPKDITLGNSLTVSTRYNSSFGEQSVYTKRSYFS